MKSQTSVVHGGRSSSASSSRRRSTGRSRRDAAASRRSGRSARRAGPREARFVHVMDLARQSRAMVVAWWNSCIIRPCCAADGRAGGGTGEEQGLDIARFVISQDSHTDFVLYVFSPCEQAIVAAAGRRLWRRWESNAAGAPAMFHSMSCLLTSLTGCLVLRFVLRSLFPLLTVSFVFQLNTCYNTHGHVSVFSKAPIVCLVHSGMLR